MFFSVQSTNLVYFLAPKNKDVTIFSHNSINQSKLLNNFSKYQTRMLYNSLNPVFGEVFEMSLQMDTKIFEYLKNKRAIFEVRHYIIERQRQKVNKMRESFDLN